METKISREKLASLNLFSNLPSEALSELASQCRLVQMSKGDILFNQGDQASTLYLIDTGEIEIVREYSDGEKLTLQVQSDGALVGELSAISSTTRLATGIARADSNLIALDSEFFFAYLGRYPEIAVSIMVVLTKRLREMNLQLRELSANNSPARIASLLLLLAEDDQGGFRTGLVTTRFSAQNIARAAGVKIEYLLNIMDEWEEEGHIGHDRRRFLLHDPEALLEIAGW